jgi:integrase
LEFALPLTRRLQEIIARRKRERTDKTNPFVFPGQGTTGYLNLRERHLSLVSDLAGIKFGLHDLRRTYLTQGFLIGHDLETLKKLANHKTRSSDDVTKGYLIVKITDMLQPMEKVGNRLWQLMT